MVGAGLSTMAARGLAPTFHLAARSRLPLVLVLLLVIGAAAALTRKQTGAQRGPGVAPAAGDSSGNAGSAALAALRYRPCNDDETRERAARGFSHPLYAQVPAAPSPPPSGCRAGAKLIEQATDVGDAPVDADTLEALVYLESAGRPNAGLHGQGGGCRRPHAGGPVARRTTCSG